MKQERDDKIGRALADAIQRHQPTDSCPDMDRFAAAVDNKLPEAELDAFRAHLAVCPRCLEAYTAAHELAQDTTSSGVQFIRWGTWAGSLIAVAAVAVLAIRISQEPQETATQVAKAPSPGTALITPPYMQLQQPPPEQKQSGTPLSSPQPIQVLLAFADADDFWNSVASGRDDTQSRPRERMREFTGIPPVMSISSSAMPPPKPCLLPLHAFQIGVSLRQVQLARDVADRTALADRQRKLAGRLEAAGQHGAALQALYNSPNVRLGVWAESVRADMVKGEQREAARLIADAGILLELGFTAGVKADIAQVVTELTAKGVAPAVKHEAILTLLAAIVADL